MKFLDKNPDSAPVVDTYLEYTTNPLQEIILTKIGLTIMHTSDFARGTNDEVYLIMPNADSQQYLPVFSNEVNAVIYWLGLICGVKLEAHEINKVINQLTHHVICEGCGATFLDDDFQAMAVSQ